MIEYVCKHCGYNPESGELPELCPVCGAPKSAFEPIKENEDNNK